MCVLIYMKYGYLNNIRRCAKEFGFTSLGIQQSHIKLTAKMNMSRTPLMSLIKAFGVKRSPSARTFNVISHPMAMTKM